MNRSQILFIVLLAINGLPTLGDIDGACTSRHPFSLDIISSPRVADITEKLTFDSTWYGNQSSTVKLRINDAEFAEGTGTGDKTWEPHRPGMYTITATTYQNGYIVGDVLTAEFEVVGRDLVNATVSFPYGMPLYDGTPRTPRVAVVYQGETLVEGQDYIVSYENNVSGVGKAIITGTGRFHDEVEQTFKILPAGICSLDICSGARIADFPEKITYDENWLSSTGAGYVRIMKNGSRVEQQNGRGEYQWTSDANGVYTFLHRTYIDGYLQDQVYSATFLVGGGSLTQDGIDVTLSPTLFAYDGTPKTPAVTVTREGIALTEGRDYSVAYRDNIEIGTGYAVVAGMGKYSDIVEKPFSITEAPGVYQVAARQRYPWNGLVDVSFKIVGQQYTVTISAKDVVGNANLPMHTIYKSGGSAVNLAGEVLQPGVCHWVWDAVSDLPKNFKCERVTVSALVSGMTNTSEEVRMDLSGMGPWEMRTARASEAINYSSAWATNAMIGANAVVKVWPVKREKPKYIAIDLSGGTAATHYPIEYFDEIPGGTWSDEYKTSKLVLRHIPAGSFIMGGRATDYPGASNTNLHMVTLTKDFYIGVFEVTQRQWELVMGNRPSAASNTLYYARRPVEMVSYMDIRGDNDGQNWPKDSKVDDDSFMGVIRRKTNLTGLDLPTSAQWEYACRAGMDTGLNSGKNALRRAGVDENASEVARYSSNSGHSSTTFDLGGDPSTCTAIVGSYLPNNYGLFDMHGNVHERVLDVATMPTESIDPVGSDLRTLRWCRGGGWQSEQHVIVAGNCSSWAPQRRTEHHGFRLCLQGGEVPELTAGTVLVNEAGEGTANWTPTKSGTYYLMHETQTNGVNGAELLGAWFTVAGPELSFTPDGDLTPGVKIAINGAGEGWTVRYEVGSGGQGSARPTTESPEYTGPITLNDSATIRAIAFSDSGMESREFSATYSLMSVVGAVARPRYPWNGKVDVDVMVNGDANLEYLVSLLALDLDGNTNLPLRTAWQTGGSTTNNVFLVRPGQYRFTWDADADIAGDFDFANVAVSVSAEGSAIVAAKKVLPLTVAGYMGAETLTNVPVLVRLSTAIAGFSYADFADADGGDLIFTDESGSIVYPHEIDEWHTSGESLVWVKLPQMVNGTKFKAAWGGPTSVSATGRAARPLAAAVWSDYAGVWHFNEDSGTAFDSTVHGLDALPTKGTNTLANTSQMVAYENGACGRARVNATNNVYNGGNQMIVPSYDGLSIGNRFIVSGWFCSTDILNKQPRLISRRKNIYDMSGWEMLCGTNYYQSCIVRGASNTPVQPNIPDFRNNWVNIACVFDANTVEVYANGGLVSSGNITAATDNGLYMSFGDSVGNCYEQFVGQYDEIRLRGGSLSAARIKADYDMIKNRNFLSYGPVESGKGATE